MKKTDCVYPSRCPVCSTVVPTSVAHHDHIYDYALDAAERITGSSDIRGTKGAHAFDRFLDLIVRNSRFTPVLLCRTCNAIEGNMEDHGLRPKYLSLSAVELKPLRLAGNPNYKAHEAELCIAQLLADFEARKTRIDDGIRAL